MRPTVTHPAPRITLPLLAAGLLLVGACDTAPDETLLGRDSTAETGGLTFGDVGTDAPDGDAGGARDLAEDQAGDSAADGQDDGRSAQLPDGPATCTADDGCPGPNDPATQPLCSGGQCTIACKGQWYDVNGVAADGCEAADDVPPHDQPQTAKVIGQVSDCANPIALSATLPSDDRAHVDQPSARPNGIPDFYAVAIIDDYGCAVTAGITVRLDLLPPAASFVLQSIYQCANGKTMPPKSLPIAGGQTASLTAGVDCSSGWVGDDSGTLVFSLTKTGGPHGGAPYVIEIDP